MSPSPRSLQNTPAAQAYTALRNASLHQLTEMRSLFESALLASPNAFHPVDIDRVRADDWQLLRFLEHTSSPTEAFNQLQDALLWKQSIGLHDKSDTDFPREFYLLNGLEILSRNAEGNIVMWVTSQYSRDFADLKPYIKDFVAHEIEYMDQMAGPYGLQAISDVKHLGLFSADIELTKYMQDIISRYYPGSVRQTLIINLSWLLEPIFKVVHAFLSAELRATTKVVSMKNLSSFVAVQLIPEEYGGTRKGKMIRVPEGALSYTEMPNIKLTNAQKNRYKTLLAALGIE